MVFGKDQISKILITYLFLFLVGASEILLKNPTIILLIFIKNLENFKFMKHSQCYSVFVFLTPFRTTFYATSSDMSILV